MRFTAEELAVAKQVDLCRVAEHLGYTVKRIGRYHMLKEMDSIRIYDRSHWCRFSRRYDKGENGGSQIDFLRVFVGMDVKEAVFWLLDFAGYRRDESMNNKPFMQEEPSADGLAAGRHASQWSGRENGNLQNLAPVEENEEKKNPFVLPEFAGSNAYLYRYLEHERGIARPVIDFFVKKGILYEAKNCHNIVFVGTDRDGVPKFASMRGVFDRNGKGFKCDVAGNDKRYGFHLYYGKSRKVVVFEAAIDLMSYITMFPTDRASMVALGMVADAPLETFLAEHPEMEEICFCLDNDGPGRKAAETLQQKYVEKGYAVNVFLPPEPYKDFNQWNVELNKAREPEKYRENARVM